MARGKRKSPAKSSNISPIIQRLWNLDDKSEVFMSVREGDEEVLLLSGGGVVPDNYSGKAYETVGLQRWEDEKDIASAEKTIFLFKDGKYHSTEDKPAVISADGTKEWYQEGLWHREGDKPAIIDGDGTRRWFKDGNPHRDGDKPAVIHPNGDRIWMQHGLFHRDGDKPAVITISGFNGKTERRREWWIVGKRHRDGDKPAIIDFNGSRHWLENDYPHRLSGPAIVRSKEEKEAGFLDQYYIYGQHYPNKKEYLAEVKCLSDEQKLEERIQKAIKSGSPTKPRKRISPLAR